MQIFLGPAGSPKPSTLEGLAEVGNLGLHAMELSFTHGVRMGLDMARQIGDANRELGIKLSIHAPYYTNLCSDDNAIRESSKRRILDTCERAHLIGASPVVFHPAYYGRMSSKEACDTVISSIGEMTKEIRRNRWDVELAPETTGRTRQFGTLDEILTVANETGCYFCVDIAHIYARNAGRINYAEIFDAMENSKIKSMHFHFEGIELNRGGEGRHLPISAGKPDFKEFAAELLGRDIDSTIICESPLTWRDSIEMKKILASLGHEFMPQNQPY